MDIFKNVEVKAIDSDFRRLGVGKRSMNDPFFKSGDRMCKTVFRVGVINDFLDNVTEADYTDEIIKNQQYICSQCKKRLPSPHLLDLHISETHDSFFSVQALRKPMYRCFVESCTCMSESAEARRSHCIDTHKFPHDFRFNYSKKSSAKDKNSPVMSVEQTPAANSITKAALNTRNFTFGKETAKHNRFVLQEPKKWNSKNKEKQVKETDIVMNDLMDTLPAV